eukprot:m.464488 g.464488  ORF g.464488 m.464488 type:complete len:215 (+) comp21619_c0_seq5:1202-1846(+)
MLVPFATTQDGFEEHFGVNCLGHVALMREVFAKELFTRNKPRVVVVSSVVHTIGVLDYQFMNKMSTSVEAQRIGQDYSCHAAYARSKLALHMATLAMARRVGPRTSGNPDVVIVDPGIVDTSLYRNIHRMLHPLFRLLAPIVLRSARDAARGVVFAALDRSLDGARGTYLNQGRVVASAPRACHVALQDALWAHCSRLLGYPDILGNDPVSSKE